MNPSRGPSLSAGRNSSNWWCWATTSVNGPIVNLPLSSSRTSAAHSAGAHNASRYSANVATGHSWRPVATAALLRLRNSSNAGQSRLAHNESTIRTKPSRSARCTRSSNNGPGIPATRLIDREHRMCRDPPRPLLQCGDLVIVEQSCDVEWNTVDHGLDRVEQ